MTASTQEQPAFEATIDGFTTLCAAFQATAERGGDEIALRDGHGSVELTWREYAERVRRIAGGLAALGVRRGDTVALMLSNRPEFHLVDTAAMHLGAIPFSIYNTSSPNQIEYLFTNAGNRVAVTEAQFLERLRAAGHAGAVVLVDGAAPGATPLEELEGTGSEGFDFEASWRAVDADDVLTLIYTSGTTGPPKGVEITHAGMLAQCRGMARVLPMRAGATITSYLPSAHIADRWSSHYNQIVFGFQVTDVADARQVGKVLPALRPTVWGGVPRVVEKLKAALEAALEAEPDEARRAAVLGAIEASRERVRLQQRGEPVPDELERRVAELDDRVLAMLRQKLGLDRAEWIIVGAAPLSEDVHEFLLAIGLPIVEIYGMSECSCCVTASSPEEARIGSVGRAIPGVELRLAEDGELLVKGPTLMRGYRRDPERTAEAIDAEGWLHTGDVAEIDDEGFVRIVDRKKELIINSGGKNMSPATIEQHLKDASPLIGQAIAIGDGRPYNVALLVLDPDAAAAYAGARDLPNASVEAVAEDPGVAQVVAEAVAGANAKLSRVEQIKRWKLLPEEWQPGGDELTPTMKLRRKPIVQKYGDVIDALYARGDRHA